MNYDVFELGNIENILFQQISISLHTEKGKTLKYILTTD